MPSMGLSLHTSSVYIINIATRHVPIATSIIIQPDLAVRSVYYDSVILMICLIYKSAGMKILLHIICM